MPQNTAASIIQTLLFFGRRLPNGTYGYNLRKCCLICLLPCVQMSLPRTPTQRRIAMHYLHTEGSGGCASRLRSYLWLWRAWDTNALMLTRRFSCHITHDDSLCRLSPQSEARNEESCPRHERSTGRGGFALTRPRRGG